ncbi:IncI1-type conjugal transfer protein TraU, partial [Shigella flexneri]
MNINRLIFTIEDCLNTLSRFSVASSFVEYCDLRTVIGLDRQDRERRPWLNSPYIAATKRGEYLSVFEVSGAFREMDEASDQTGSGSLESLITSMSDSLNTAYKNSGHKISCVFERDPEMGKEEIEDMVAPQKRSLANTGIQLQDVVDEKVTTLSPWLVRERCWLAIWSGPDLISNSDRTAHDELVRRLAERVPKARFAQSPWQWTLSALKIRHEAFLDNVEQALRHSSDGLILRLLDIHEVGREIRRQTERYSTPRNWQPHLPEDAQPAGYRWTDDESVLHAPSLHLQLFNTQVTTQGNLVQAGGLWHGMVSITLPPQNLQTFNELVRAVPRAVP